MVRETIINPQRLINIMNKKTPKTIGIIPDGNRRYAEKHDIPYEEAYKKGIEKGRKIIEWSVEQDIENIVIYALSLENVEKRDKIPEITELFKDAIHDILQDSKIHEQEVKIQFAGNWLEGMVEEIILLEEATEQYEKHKLYPLLNYSGEDEVKRTIDKYNPELGEFEDYLEVPIDIDLVIRTGGKKRLSGFCPLQSSYAELRFSDTLWAEFTEKEFKEILDTYEEEDRSFGE